LFLQDFILFDITLLILSQMYANNAYLNNTTRDIKDKSKPLIVTSCGTYRLFSRPKLPTWRPRGRLDYQLLYVASGKTHFHIGGKERIVTAGHMVLYRPKEPQKYEYYCTEQPEVYWVHFTGGNVKNLLRSYGMRDDMHVFYCGSGLEYQNHFREMIRELQMCRDDYQEMAEIHLRQIFIMIHRYLQTTTRVDNSQMAEEIDEACIYFSEHYNEEISIEEYAQTHNMSTCWFIRNFKQYTGSTPMQYILALRIANAEALLRNTQYNITEVAAIVGYQNPLYFSRMFRKAKGLSPSEYRKQIK